MRIVLAFDSFKGSMSAQVACRVAADALRSINPSWHIIEKPMADGGEGTAAAMLSALHGEWISARAMGPLPDMEVDAGFAWFSERRHALVETAAASGLTLLRRDQMNPLKTTTYGTGTLLAKAIQKGAQHIGLAVGGSATVDGGVGAAMALGWKFLDRDNQSIGLGGGELEKIASLVPPSVKFPPTEVLCDVQSILCGMEGAAHLYSPQKGATPDMVQQLDAGLLHLGRLVEEQLGKDILSVAGGGAAGGLAAGAAAFLNAKLVPGIQTVMTACGLREALKGADWVITGEGSFDSQSLRGKVVSGVIQAARRAGAKVGVVAGRIMLKENEYRSAGAAAALATSPTEIPQDETMASQRLTERVKDFAERFLVAS